MNDWQEKIHAYADGECDAAEKQAVEAHTAADDQAARELSWALALRSLVRVRCQIEPCQDTWGKAMTRLDAIDKAKRTESVVGKFGWALCGVFLVAIVSAGVMNRMVGGRVLDGTQISSIFDSLRPVVQPSVSSSDRLHVQLPFGAPEVAVPTGMEVLGARAGAYNGKRVVSLTLLDHEGPLSILMVDGLDKVEGIAPDPFGGKYAVGLFNGRMCATWKQDSYTVLLMGDRSTDELKALAKRLVPDDGAPARQ